MYTKQENGWTVPIWETLLNGSCRPSFHVHYRDWDKLKTAIFEMDETNRRTFVDLGANFGLISVVAKQYFKRVIAVEPHPVTAECLRNNMSKEIHGMPSGTYQVIEAAAGQYKDMINVYTPSDPQTSGYTSTTAHDGWTPQRVKQISIDSLGLTNCDFMKLDVQGAEHDALMGAEQTVRLHRPIVYCETKEGTECVDLLKSWGYKVMYDYQKGHLLLHHKKRRLASLR
tara:strand:- start:486 stop:1169 length:684 start_codon:yes stop_codon:yes gene_type:complete